MPSSDLTFNAEFSALEATIQILYRIYMVVELLEKFQRMAYVFKSTRIPQASIEAMATCKQMYERIQLVTQLASSPLSLSLRCQSIECYHG